METNVFEFSYGNQTPDPFFPYMVDCSVPLVIDNGSFKFRVGWASNPEPSIVARSLLCKQRGKKDWESQVGNDIPNLDAVRWALRSPFERNVVTHVDVQEFILDHVFSRLSIDTEEKVAHPVVISEPLANPNFCRQQMNELLFEGYGVPSVAWGIDCLFSFYTNCGSTPDGLIVSLGGSDSTLLPVLDGVPRVDAARRINVGGENLIETMQKTMQFKYPAMQSKITVGRCEEILRSFCRVSTNFFDDLKKWNDADFYDANVIKIRLHSSSSPTKESEARLKREQQAERMREIAARRRKEVKRKKVRGAVEELEREEEKLNLEMARLRRLTSVKDKAAGVSAGRGAGDDGGSRGGEGEEKFEIEMANLGFTTTQQLDNAIAKLRAKIDRLKENGHTSVSKLASSNDVVTLDEAANSSSKLVFDLLEVPDNQLSDEQLAAKKKQLTLHRLQQGRIRARVAREQKKGMNSVDSKRLEEKRTRDFKGWLNEIRKRRHDILASKTRRHQRKSEMAKRHSAAAQKRMKIITELAKGGGGGAKKNRGDSFGSREEDWEVYKRIDLEGGESESEEENEALERIERILKDHDPEFSEIGFIGTSSRNVERDRIEIGLEQIRVPEILFQPSIVGRDQMGLAECAESVLALFQEDRRQRLVDNIFVTGGSAQFRGMEDRIQAEITMMRPFGSTSCVTTARSPSLDAWHGARAWALDGTNIERFSLARADYLEMGGDYLKEHTLSNRFVKLYSSGSQG